MATLVPTDALPTTLDFLPFTECNREVLMSLRESPDGETAGRG